MQEHQKKTGLVSLVHKLPRTMQRCLLGVGFLQRSQTYITKLPGMIAMLNKHGQQSDELVADLKKRGLENARSIFINMGGMILHVLYLPPKNGKLVCAFHGIKGNWLNNPNPLSPLQKDTSFNPRYRMLLLEEFASDGFGFLAFTMPGFDPSEGLASEENFIKAADAFAAYTKNLALKTGIRPQNIIICGESLGGATAAIFAAKMTENNYAPGVLSLIATFDSLISMTHNEFPIFNEVELSKCLRDKLDTTKELQKLIPNKTYIHMVSTESDNVIPIQNTLNLLGAARKLGFNVLYTHLNGNHTTWDAKAVLNGKKLTHIAREKGIEIAEHQTVMDIEKIISNKL